ncbi:MAG: hypothetical protein U0V56_07805 [Actinomycetota bacterium]
MSPRSTRRGFLVAAGGAVAVLAVRTGPWKALVAYRSPSDAERLVGMLTHVESARVVGRAYLREVSRKRSVEGLVAEIASGLPGGRSSVRGTSDADLRRIVSASIRGDFAREANVTVQGWILSETEARLCALAALL